MTTKRNIPVGSNNQDVLLNNREARRAKERANKKKK